MFSDIYRGRKVLITGHKGFKGSWLALWLKHLGAEVAGYSLDPDCDISHLTLLELDIQSETGDISNREHFGSFYKEFKPDVVFHLAAQALVRYSYDNPWETYQSNVMGSLSVMELCREFGTSALVNITSDKSYKNNEWVWGYRECDPLGGYDPYSSSKACADILANAYRDSYFNLSDYGSKHNTLLASCRAGNVIGGGDWSKDRLLVDLMVAASRGERTIIRSPNATRPWQHVLEPLSGYLAVGAELLKGNLSAATAWNFGPANDSVASVAKIAAFAQQSWSKVGIEVDSAKADLHEAKLLSLDSSKANQELKWFPQWGMERAVASTVDWYKTYYESGQVRSVQDLEAYLFSARSSGVAWAR